MFLSVGHEKNVIYSKLVNNPFKATIWQVRYAFAIVFVLTVLDPNNMFSLFTNWKTRNNISVWLPSNRQMHPTYDLFLDLIDSLTASFVLRFFLMCVVQIFILIQNHLDSRAWQKNSSTPNFIEFGAKSLNLELFMIFGFHLHNKVSLFVIILFRKSSR